MPKTSSDASAPAASSPGTGATVPGRLARSRLHRIPLDLLARAPRVGADHAALWRQFMALLDKTYGDRRATVRRAVLANLVGIAAFGDPADFVAVADLAAHLGESRLARVQDQVSRLLDTDDAMPWTTQVVRRLATRALTTHGPGDCSTGDADASSAAVCGRVAINLVFAGVDPTRQAAPIETVAQLHACIDSGSVPDWRAHLGMVAAAPWSPDVAETLEVARLSDRSYPYLVLRSVVARCREWYKDRERDQVAAQIRTLVSVSGLSQREFATRIGTSPSRLSSYLKGTVTPSAAIVLRIQRVSRALQDQLGVEMGSGA